MRFDREIAIKKCLEVDRRWKNTVFRKFCSGKEQTGFDWNMFGTPGTIPEPSSILVFFDNFIRPKMASRAPCLFRHSVVESLTQKFPFTLEKLRFFKVAEIWKYDNKLVYFNHRLYKALLRNKCRTFDAQ
jgi:hypothetical protein